MFGNFFSSESSKRRLTILSKAEIGALARKAVVPDTTFMLNSALTLGDKFRQNQHRANVAFALDGSGDDSHAERHGNDPRISRTAP